MCLHQRGQNNRTTSATRQMPASSPAGISPFCPTISYSCPTISYSCPTVQQGCPSRAGPVHNPVQSQSEHTPELMGLQQCRKEEGKEQSHHPCCAPFISNWWLCEHTRGRTGSTRGSATAKLKYRQVLFLESPGELKSCCLHRGAPAPLQTVLLVPQPWDGSCGGAAGGKATCTTPGDTLPLFASRNPTHMQRVELLLEYFQPQNTHSAFRKGEEDGVLPAAL